MTNSRNKRESKTYVVAREENTETNSEHDINNKKTFKRQLSMKKKIDALIDDRGSDLSDNEEIDIKT